MDPPVDPVPPVDPPVDPVDPPVDPVDPPVDPVDPPVDPVDPPVEDPVDPPIEDPVDPPIEDPEPPVDPPVDPQQPVEVIKFTQNADEFKYQPPTSDDPQNFLKLFQNEIIKYVNLPITSAVNFIQNIFTEEQNNELVQYHADTGRFFFRSDISPSIVFVQLKFKPDVSDGFLPLIIFALNGDNHVASICTDRNNPHFQFMFQIPTGGIQDPFVELGLEFKSICPIGMFIRNCQIIFSIHQTN